MVSLQSLVLFLSLVFTRHLSLGYDWLLTGAYRQHLRRQEKDVRLFLQDETLLLDAHLDYHSIEGLSSEVKERLSAVRPANIVSSLPYIADKFGLLRYLCSM